MAAGKTDIFRYMIEEEENIPLVKLSQVTHCKYFKIMISVLQMSVYMMTSE